MCCPQGGRGNFPSRLIRQPEIVCCDIENGSNMSCAVIKVVDEYIGLTRVYMHGRITCLTIK